MNWTDHNLTKNGDVVSVAAWQEFDWLIQGFSLKSAGNIDFRFGDATQARENISNTLSINSGSWVGMRQVHSSHIEVVGADSESDFSETDGMITKEKNKLLSVVVADCVPLFLVDPITKTVAVAHAGRRGTIAGIAKEVVKGMLELGSKVENIQVAIGPSIGPCCYEINPETHEHFDLWSTNEQQLREVGVKTIIRTDVCTKDHNDLFFSHRADEVHGRFAGLVGLK